MKILVAILVAVLMVGCASTQDANMRLQMASDLTAQCAVVAQKMDSDIGKLAMMEKCAGQTRAMVAVPENKTGKYILSGLSVLAKAWVGVKGVEALADFGIAAVENAGGNVTNTIGNDGFIGDGGVGFTVSEMPVFAPAPVAVPAAEEPAL